MWLILIFNAKCHMLQLLVFTIIKSRNDAIKGTCLKCFNNGLLASSWQTKTGSSKTRKKKSRFSDCSVWRGIFFSVVFISWWSRSSVCSSFIYWRALCMQGWSIFTLCFFTLTITLPLFASPKPIIFSICSQLLINVIQVLFKLSHN